MNRSRNFHHWGSISRSEPPSRGGWEGPQTSWAELYCTHSHCPDGRDREPATIHAASCSGGTTDMGPTFSAFGKCLWPLQQGQQALSLVRMDFICVEGTTCIFLRAQTPWLSTRCIFEALSSTHVLWYFWYYIWIFMSFLCLMDYIYFTNVFTCACVCLYYMCARCQSNIWLARVSITWFNLVGTWKYVI